MKQFILMVVLGLLVTLVSWAEEEKTGEWVCSKCDGAGSIFIECRKCKSTGVCKACQGAMPDLCSKCFGKKGKVCKRCDGQGYKVYSGKKRKCSTCRGKGMFLCRKCKGKGKIVCRICEGTGQCVSCSGTGKVPKEECNACKGEGGRWREPGLKDLVKQNGGSLLTERAVLSGLTWLARHQNANGSWGAKTFQEQCPGDTKCSGTAEHETVDIGLTGLALLAFAGANYSPGSKDIYEGICFGEVVRKAALYLKDIQEHNGAFCEMGSKPMYNQALAVYAMADLVNLMKDKGEDPALFQKSAHQGADFIIKSRNPGKAWRYAPKCGDNDVSVTGWCVMALKTAREGGLNMPEAVWAGVKSHLDDVTDKKYGQVGYIMKSGAAVLGKWEAELLNAEKLYMPPSLAAIGIILRLSMGEKSDSAVIEKSVGLLMKNLPAWNIHMRGKIDYYYWYYGSYAMYEYDGPKGNRWKKWNRVLKDLLLAHQKTAQDGCTEGSWEPLDRWSDEAGRVYATAINVLTLEVYYRCDKKK